MREKDDGEKRRKRREREGVGGRDEWGGMGGPLSLS